MPAPASATRLSALRCLAPVLGFAWLGAAGCDGTSNPVKSVTGPDMAFVSNCSAGDAGADGRRPPGPILDGGAPGAILPGGRLVTPQGTLLDIGGYPINIRVLPGDRYAVVTDDAVKDQALLVVDLEAADPDHPDVSAIPYPIGAGGVHTPGLFYGLALTKEGSRVYVSNGGYDPIPDSKPQGMHVNTIEVYDLVPDKTGAPQLTKNEALTIELKFTPSGPGWQERLTAGLALSSDEKTLYVACQGDNSLAIVDLTPGATYGSEIGTAAIPGLAPYDVAVDEATNTAFVSLWGGLHENDGSYVEGVVPVDVADKTKPMAAASPISTGKAAEVELYMAGRIYVANADADTLSVIDAATKEVKTSPVTTSMILGATPNNLAVDPGYGGNPGRIYLANANENAVVALDLETFAIIGYVPTAWYPTAVAVRSDGSLAIASARGLGTGPLDAHTESVRFEGTMQVLPRPSDDELRAGSQTVLTNLDRPRTLEPQLTCPQGSKPEEQRFPIPAQAGAPSAIKYVFFIVRENKTYDSVFGDLGIGNGDPSLMAFTADMIPNARALAKEFVLLDNYYAHSELSIQGHEWTTGCIANDYVEKGWGATDDYGRGYRPDAALSATQEGRLGYPGSDSIWVHLDKAKIPYHNYGEVTNLLGARTVLDPSYPGVFFNTGIKDVDKERYIVDNILAEGDQLEPFSYMLLPNDHTSATLIGASQPASMMADNDEATGRFVDEISHSALWPESLIVVLEDDPGGLGDHVEQHRSICLLASPWIRRHYVSSSMFDIASVYRTVELIIGAPPLNEYDAHAPVMYELFTTTPDYTPYDFIPRKIAEAQNTAADPMAEEWSAKDFARPDQVDVSRALWKVTHGKDAEPPWLGKRRPRWTLLRHDDDDANDKDGDGR